MKEIEEFPLVTAFKRRHSLVFLALFACASIAGSGCTIKQTVKVNVPQGIRDAKTAGFEQLLEIIRGYDTIKALSCNEMDVTFVSSRKIDIGELEKYPTVHGYILLQRPDSTHLVLQTPLVGSKFLDVLSIGDALSVWYPRKNEFYEGKNSAKELVVDDASGSREFTVPIRGSHIFEALFPQSVSLDSQGVWVSLEEQRDDRASYYVLTFSREGIRPRSHTIREIWIERLGLTIARQQVFADNGQVVSSITYSNQVMTDGFPMPLNIHIDRPIDGYTLDLEFKSWRINPDLPAEAFQLQPPPNAKIVPLREKRK